jgi:maltooligosyltrehalose trehalohydrolase
LLPGSCVHTELDPRHRAEKIGHRTETRIGARTERSEIAAAKRRLPIGAEAHRGGTHFRVWAPRANGVDLLLEGLPDRARQETVALQREAEGYFSAWVDDAPPGTRYRYRLHGVDGAPACPDPASRSQPEGPHGPSAVVDPSTFAWSDASWHGIRLAGQVIYEMHVGTFTRDGTWRAAAHQLESLRDLGVTTIEMMPVASFTGRFGWGYDGVALFAPYHVYGTADELRAFVDRAHQLGLGVILDVVYNHLGPDGCYLPCFSASYLTRHRANEWGDGINFDGAGSAPVREFFLANAAYWIDEFHFDGLRLDATHRIYDDSAEHIVAAIVRAVRNAAGKRSVVVVAENEDQVARFLQSPEDGGYGVDAAWNDDFHHSARIALTRQNDSYLSDFRGTPQELIAATRWGYLFQGQRSAFRGQRRGTPAFGIPPMRFVDFLQNHDQIANTGQGIRIARQAGAARYRAMAALLLLGPGTPLLFQGQEFGATTPFVFFADHREELAAQVREGRREFLSRFPPVEDPAVAELLADPADPRAFERCKLDPRERERATQCLAFHRDLLALRRSDAAFRAQGAFGIEGATLGDTALVLRFFGAASEARLLIVNLGAALDLPSVAEPLLAPAAEGCPWTLRWSSEDARYGGAGAMLEPEADDGWHVGATSTVVLGPGGASGR